MNWSEQHMNCNYMKLVLLSTLFYLLISNQVDAGEFDNIKVDVLAKSGFSWDGSHLPSYSKGVPEITILRITIPPHTQLPLISMRAYY